MKINDQLSKLRKLALGQDEEDALLDTLDELEVAIQADLDSYEEVLVAHERKNAELVDLNTDLEEKISELKSEITDLKGEISNLNNHVDSMEEDIHFLKDSHREEVRDLNEQIDDLRDGKRGY